MPATHPILVCEGLVRRFGERTAVDDLSLTVAAGETFGLLGPNGAGKTTAISMVAGILAPDAGRVRVAGELIDTGAVEAKSAIGLVPQDIALYDDLTAVENLRFFGRLQSLGGHTLEGRIRAVLGGSSETRNACIHAVSRTLLPVVYPNFSHFLPQSRYPAWDRDHPSDPSGYAHQLQAPVAMLRC